MSYTITNNVMYVRNDAGELVPVSMIASGADQTIQAIRDTAAAAEAQIDTKVSDANAAIETKTDEQVARIPEVTTLAEDVNGLKDDLAYQTDSLRSGRKVIANSYPASSGAIEDGTGRYNSYCFRVAEGQNIESMSSGSELPMVYAFYTDEPEIGSISYNSGRVVTAYPNITGVRVPDGCTWVAIRCSIGSVASITPKSFVIKKIEDRLLKAEEKIQSIESEEIIINFKLGNYAYKINTIPDYQSDILSRMCSDGFYLFKKGETISVLHSDLSIRIMWCDKEGVLYGYEDYCKYYDLQEDRYAYIVVKSESVSNFNGKVEAYSYFFHTFRRDQSIWKNKTWYSFGTSMTDINPDGVSGNNGTMGKYPLVIDELSGMVRVNKAIGSGGICPSAPHGGNVKANILSCPYDVDLVTLECGLNDWGSVPLGDIGDVSDDTFIGNFTQCIQYLTYNTRAKIVLITMVGLTYTNTTDYSRRSPFFKNDYGKYYREYIDAQIQICKLYGVEVIDAQANALSDGRKNRDTIIDTVHFTDLGAHIFGRYVWSKLKDVNPIPKMPNGY